ncbi:MAG: hypothetical protein IAA72_01430 [Spirochaetes bacterium]|uniref:Uncharacterized protein n=1 Tax=Candidatus Ornithospirochaeta stercoravium TaxID=2840897 RepID=A0A9D9I9S9_9SPIO|nr:hypothetical protein [Candidatus Ornithospirochaeta stercoravium]
MFENCLKLGIVYKDTWEIALNQIRTLIDTKDTVDDKLTSQKIGAIETIQYSVKQWMHSDLPTKTTSKILFLGSSKASEAWIPVLKPQISKYGVDIRWSGKHAAIWISRKIKDASEYLKFYEELKKYPIPESCLLLLENCEGKDKLFFEKIAKLAFSPNKVLPIWNPLWPFAKKFEYLTSIQQTIYGVFQFYYNGLEEFMNS